MAHLNCGECAIPFLGVDDRIKCNGYCNRVFHLSCTSVDAYDARRCLDIENLLWMCTRCLSSFREQIATKATTNSSTERNIEPELETTVSELQMAIEEIKQRLANFERQTSAYCSNILDTIAPSTSTPSQSGANEVGSRLPLSRDDSRCSKLFTGSKVEIVEPNVRRKFWIFFTGVANHVTCNQLSGMVMNCLALNDPPDVTKLVPRWRHAEDLHHVSFKVGVDWTYKEKALSESTWPSGLLFREFVPRKLCCWEP